MDIIQWHQRRSGPCSLPRHKKRNAAEETPWKAHCLTWPGSFETSIGILICICELAPSLSTFVLLAAPVVVQLKLCTVSTICCQLLSTYDILFTPRWCALLCCQRVIPQFKWRQKSLFPDWLWNKTCPDFNIMLQLDFIPFHLQWDPCNLSYESLLSCFISFCHDFVYIPHCKMKLLLAFYS